MKFRLIALILTLALALVGWAQDTPAAPNSTPAPQAKACCHQNMAGKEGKGCCHHAAADAKDAAACCSKDKCEMKDGKSCCDGKNMKAAMKKRKKNGCCADGKCCPEGKSCGEAKGAKTAMGCCGGKCQGHQHTPSET